MASATHLENVPEDRAIGVLSVSFDFGLVQLTSMFLVGGTLVLQPVQIPAEIVETVKRQGVTGTGDGADHVDPARQADGGERDRASRRPLRRELRRPAPAAGAPRLAGDLPPCPPLPHVRHDRGVPVRATCRPRTSRASSARSGNPFPTWSFSSSIRRRGSAVRTSTASSSTAAGSIGMGYWNAPEATADKIKPCQHLRISIGDEKVLYSGDTVYRDEDGRTSGSSRGRARLHQVERFPDQPDGSRGHRLRERTRDRCRGVRRRGRGTRPGRPCGRYAAGGVGVRHREAPPVLPRGHADAACGRASSTCGPTPCRAPGTASSIGPR
ncbi:MAG: hypothetical protein MZV70_05555 [Desulfobacterales bacterium]|nr:hypothetical protein [Desulfobacterales bacterium]